MIFVNTQLASPVVYGKDLPYDKDLFHVKPEEIPTKKAEYSKFIKKYTTDKEWWSRQYKKCVNGMVVPKGVKWEGGDVFIDGVNMEVLPDGSRRIPYLGITIPVNKDDPNYGDLPVFPKLYFYLNFWKISRENQFTGRKDLLNPWLTDLTWENWAIRYYSWKLGVDIGWFKSRQRGMSEEEAGDTGYDMLFFNDCQVAIVGGQDYYNENTFKMVKRGVYNLYNTQFYKEIAKDNEEIFSTANTGMEVYSRTAKNNPQVCSGLNSLVKAHLEEIGIMPHGLVGRIAQAIKPSIKTRGRHRTGFIVYTGTSGEFTTDSGEIELGIYDIEKMLYNPKSYELFEVPNLFDKDVDPGSTIACFIPAWKFRIMDDDHNSKRQESIDDIYDERSKLKPEEKAKLTLFEPIYTNEMFDTTLGGYFGEHIIHHLNTARSFIVTHKSKQVIERGFLHFNDPRDLSKGVRWEDNMEEGDVLIAEHPQKDSEGNMVPNLYGLGTDSYDFDQAKTSSSKLACLVYKGYNDKVSYEQRGIYNNFVAMYLDRPDEGKGGRETAYENTIKLTLYYMGYNLIEYSNLLIFKHFEDLGVEGFLKLRPDFAIAANVERSDVSNKYGFPAALKPKALKMLRDWLANKDNIYNCPFEELLKAWAKFKYSQNYNCDVTIASSLCIVSAENDIIEARKSEDEYKKVIKTFRGYKTINGMLTAIYQ